MILADLRDFRRYKQIIPYFSELNNFLKTHDLNTFATGKISIIEEEIFINIVEFALKSKQEQIIEAHQEYLDIHIPLNTKETIGWKKTEECTDETKPYEKDNDCVLFSDVPDVYFTVKPGQFAVVFPEDAHAPAIGEGIIKKAIVKIKITPFGV